MRLTERRKMEVNENRGRLGRKNFRGKSVKQGTTKMKKTSPEREKGKPQQRKYDCFPIRQDLSSVATTIILPWLPAVCARLFHSWGRLTHSAFTFRFRQKGQQKKKNHLKTRKSTSWHRRNALFSSYAVVGTRLFQTRFGQWCADGQYRFYGKFLWMRG